MSGDSAQNRVSVLTPAGRGAVAVVAACGPLAIRAVDLCFQAANGRRVLDQRQDRIVFGHWTTGGHREEIVMLRGDGDSLEIHCHGGAAAVSRIVEALTAAGCLQLSWPEWLAMNTDDFIAVEADCALAEATTRRTAAILLDQRNGALAQCVRLAQAALQRADAVAAMQVVVELLGRSSWGVHLTTPWQVSIAGRPNVGKSSLINALVGYQRAIVFDQPGTTRDVLAAETAIDGWPVRLTDAAGIRPTDDPLEAAGVEQSRGQLSRADLVLWVIDATAVRETDESLTRARLEFQEEIGGMSLAQRPLIVVNKVDLLSLPPAVHDPDVLAVSALTKAGLPELLDRIATRLAPEPPPAGAAVAFTARQVECLTAAQRHLQDADFSGAHLALERLISGRQAGT